MLKIELTKYPLSSELIDDMIVFLIYNQINTIEELIAISDEELKSKHGFKPEFLEAAHLIRGMELN